MITSMTTWTKYKVIYLFIFIIGTCNVIHVRAMDNPLPLESDVPETHFSRRTNGPTHFNVMIGSQTGGREYGSMTDFVKIRALSTIIDTTGQVIGGVCAKGLERYFFPEQDNTALIAIQRQIKLQEVHRARMQTANQGLAALGTTIEQAQKAYEAQLPHLKQQLISDLSKQRQTLEQKITFIQGRDIGSTELAPFQADLERVKDAETHVDILIEEQSPRALLLQVNMATAHSLLAMLKSSSKN